MNTPIEKYNGVYVKREDLAFSDALGAPPFSKIRGIATYLQEIEKQNIKYVGYMETAISMASWGISWTCHSLNLKPIIYYPKYKEYKYNQEKQIAISKKYGAKLIPINKPNYQKVNFYKARKHFQENYKNGVMLDLGLPLNETLIETKKQAESAIQEIMPKTIVVSVGSGTIMAGILRAMACYSMDITCIGVLAAQKKIEPVERTIAKRAGCVCKGFLGGIEKKQLKIVDSCYNYYEKPEITAPFDCNANYDLKAWRWIKDNESSLETPILFWNIGGEYEIKT